MSYTKKEFPKDYIPTGKGFVTLLFCSLLIQQHLTTNLFVYLLVVDNYDVLLALGEGQNLKLTVVDTAGKVPFAL